jgi:AcrR family transcriptional regulator
MAEGGLSNLTVEGTAQRAGVAKTTVYRRYPTKLDLAMAAVAALVSGPPEGHSVEESTAAGMQAWEQYMGSSGAQAAFMAVAAAAAADPEIHARFSETVVAPVRENVMATIHAAQEGGQASDDPPVDFIFDVTIGTLIHRQVIRQEPLTPEFAAQFTELLKRLMTLHS